MFPANDEALFPLLPFQRDLGDGPTLILICPLRKSVIYLIPLC